jgi:formamidopyrimidine-DNA glycosylase
MPELPEVETLRRALAPLVENKTLRSLKFFRKDIRFPIPQKEIRAGLINQKVSRVQRVGKYLLFHAPSGALLLHLGMSGRVTQQASLSPIEKHTHAVFHFGPETYLHFIDARRFGCILWAPRDTGHALLNHLGPDPLDPELTAKDLKLKARKCRAAIKSFLMDSKRISGVGNIYACEALFGARISPSRQAGRLTLREWEGLLAWLRVTLEKSIAAGGTTLRDFFNADGSSGYFAVDLAVYGRENQPCLRCKAPIVRKVQTGRSTFYCKVCQKK